MATFELNIYGENDEILKTFATDKIRWGLLLQAYEAQQDIKDKPKEEQIIVIGELIKKLFPTLTSKELECADLEDMFFLFQQLLRKVNNIKAGHSKNADGEV